MNAGVCVLRKEVKAELAAVGMGSMSRAATSRTNEQQYSSILEDLRGRRQCNSEGCIKVPHAHVKDDPACAMLLSSVEYSITKKGSTGNNLPGLLSCSTAARHISMLVKAGVTTLSFPLSMYYPHPHVDCKQVSIFKIYPIYIIKWIEIGN